MAIFVTVLLFLLGLALIIKGGDFFVDAAAWTAETSGIPKFIIGATVVSFATTLPEMLVSLIAAAQGKTDMAIGNAVGSVTANIGLIMAISVLFIPAVINRKDYTLKSCLMLSAAATVAAFGFSGKLTLLPCLLLLAVFAAAMYENVSGAIKSVKAAGKDDSRPKPVRRDIIINIVKFALGTAGIVWGADLLVDNGSELARYIGVSERVIGVTLVAIGTSLPELVTTVTAIAKKQSQLSVGNIIGANIIDLCLIMPLSALVSGQSLPVGDSSRFIDLPACLLVGVVALVPALIHGRFSRWQGVVLLVLFAGYMVLTVAA